MRLKEILSSNVGVPRQLGLALLVLRIDILQLDIFLSIFMIDGGYLLGIGIDFILQVVLRLFLIGVVVYVPDVSL